MTHKPNDPQIHEPATVNLRAGVRLDETDHRERGMPVAQQLTHTDGNPRRRLGRGERLAIIIAALVTVGSLAGVAVLATRGDSNRTAAPTATPTSATPSLTKQPASVEDLAVAAAEARYRGFLRARDVIGQGSYKTSAPFDAVSVMPERTIQEVIFRKARGTPGRHQVGDTTLAFVNVADIDLTPSPGGYRKVVLQACVDVSGVDILDAAGKSIVKPNRQARSRSTVTMYEYTKGTKGATAGGWYVYQATARGEAC